MCIVDLPYLCAKKKLKARQYIYICSIERVTILQKKICSIHLNTYSIYFFFLSMFIQSISFFLLLWITRVHFDRSNWTFICYHHREKEKKRWKTFTQRLRSVTIHQRYSYLKIEGFSVPFSSPCTYSHYPYLHPWRQSDNHEKKDDEKLDRQTHTHTNLFYLFLAKKKDKKGWCQIIIKYG
jgi:hypothetical protein